MANRPNFPRETRVVLYLRRSDEKQEESVATQRAAATRYCEAKGWNIVSEYVDEDKHSSRAEFKRRKGLIALQSEAIASAPGKRRAKPREWSVVVARDGSRIGGDALRVGLLLADLRDAGVSTVYYKDDEIVQLDTATDRMMLNIRASADEMERERIGSRTIEALAERVHDGRVAGSAAYGYRIVGERRKRHYEIHPEQAQVVRRIFDAHASGQGYRAIAASLDADRVPAPTNAGKHALGVWSQRTVRKILMNERYAGKAKHGREAVVYRGGTKMRVQREADQVIEYVTPAIVTPEQWQAVAKRMAANPRYGKAVGTRGAKPKHLLTGHTRCAACGGAVHSIGKSGGRGSSYACGRRRAGGSGVCSNVMSPQIAIIDRVVIDELLRQVQGKAVVRAFELLRGELVERLRIEPDERATVERDIAAVSTKLKRLAKAIEATEESDGPLVQSYRERGAELETLKARRASLDTSNVVIDELDAMLARARELSPTTTLLSPGEDARALFAAVLDGGHLVMSGADKTVAGTLDAGAVLAGADSGTGGTARATVGSPHALKLRIPFFVRWAA